MDTDDVENPLARATSCRVTRLNGEVFLATILPQGGSEAGFIITTFDEDFQRRFMHGFD
jgi:hypothetical protein